MTARLALGTVQFGMSYGIANRSGRPPADEVVRILQAARLAEIDMIDTAIAYGEAEHVLGEAGLCGWKVVTKLPSVPDDVIDIAGWMEAQTTASLSRLRIASLHGVLLHAPAQMHGLRAGEMARGLQSLATRGLAARVGVSIQHPDDDLPAILQHMMPGIIQCPFNLLDTALVTHGWAARLRAAGCEVHARSAFLQGLLLMQPAARPSWTTRYGPVWDVWDEWLGQQGITASEACLRFVRSAPGVDFAVVGVDNADQLAELIAIGSKPLPVRPEWPAMPGRNLITPSLWPRT